MVVYCEEYPSEKHALARICELREMSLSVSNTFFMSKSPFSTGKAFCHIVTGGGRTRASMLYIISIAEVNHDSESVSISTEFGNAKGESRKRK